MGRSVDRQDVVAIAEEREASLRRVFRKYDVNGDGLIDSTELALLLSDLLFSDKVVEEELAKADADDNQKLNFLEFCAYYNKLLEDIRAKTCSIRLKSRNTAQRRRSSGTARFSSRRASLEGATPRRAAVPPLHVRRSSVGGITPTSSRPPAPAGHSTNAAATHAQITPRLAVLKKKLAKTPGSTGLATGRRRSTGGNRGSGRGGGHETAPGDGGKGAHGQDSSERAASTEADLEAELPPRPELIRFDSITDEIAAFKRGEISAPSSDAHVDNRVACTQCGRKFVPKSIQRHEDICKRAAENARRRGKFQVKRS